MERNVAESQKHGNAKFRPVCGREKSAQGRSIDLLPNHCRHSVKAIDDQCFAGLP